MNKLSIHSQGLRNEAGINRLATTVISLYEHDSNWVSIKITDEELLFLKLKFNLNKQQISYGYLYLLSNVNFVNEYSNLLTALIQLRSGKEL